jgi:hypothetical protein
MDALVLPMPLPQPCPICGAKVILLNVTEWESDTGKPIAVEYECETEPPIDSDDWEDWHSGHFAMPYVDWLPWEMKMMAWLQARYYYREPTESRT